MTESPDERREASMRDFMSVLFRRKWIVIGFLLAAAAVVMVLRTVSPTLYESSAQILLSRGQTESAYDSRVKLVLPWEEELNSEIETVRSSHIVQLAQKILDDGKIKDSHGLPVKIDPNSISSNPVGKSTIIFIKTRDPDPAAAQQITRAITQAYTNFRLNVRSVPELEAYFREEIDGLREQLEDWEQRRADFMDRESVAGLNEERNSLISTRGQTESDLNHVREELAAEQERVSLSKGLVTQSLSDSAPGPYTFTEGTNAESEPISAIRHELVTRQSELLAAESKYQEDYPEVVSLREEVNRLRVLLTREVTGYVQHLQAKVDVLRAQEDALQTVLSQSDSELASYPHREARLASFDRVIDALQTDYRALVEKQIQARLERIGSSDWNVLVLQPASEPQAVRVIDAVRLSLIPIIALILSIAFAFLVDGLDHSVKDATEAERHLGLPVLGSVGRLR